MTNIKKIKQFKINEKCIVYTIFSVDEEENYSYTDVEKTQNYILYEKDSVTTLYKVTSGTYNYKDAYEPAQIRHEVCNDFKFKDFEDAQNQIDAYFGALTI